MDYGSFRVFLRNTVKWRVHRNMCRIDGILVWISSLVGPGMETLAYIPIIHKGEYQRTYTRSHPLEPPYRLP